MVDNATQSVTLSPQMSKLRNKNLRFPEALINDIESVAEQLGITPSLMHRIVAEHGLAAVRKAIKQDGNLVRLLAR